MTWLTYVGIAGATMVLGILYALLIVHFGSK